MKKKLFSICLLMYLTQVLFGQTEPRLYKQTYTLTIPSLTYPLVTDYLYEYDEKGNLIELIYISFDEEGIEYNRQGDFYSFNSDNQLIKSTNRRYNSEVNLWITNNWVEYEYDANGCVIARRYIRNIGGLFSEALYERNADCQLTKEIYSSKITIPDSFELRHIYERTYFSDGISYRETRSEPQAFLNNELVVKSIWDTYLHANGDLDEVYTTFNDNYGDYKYEAKYIYEYDQFENLTNDYLYRKDAPDPEYVLLNHKPYVNEYDDENRLVHYHSDFIDYTIDPPQYHYNVNNFNFEYWCKDLEKSSIQNISDGFYFIQTESFYEGINECFEAANELLEIDVFPNPTTGSVTINSSIFNSGDTQISVFDMNGNLLLEKNESRRGALMELDLVDLPNGIYVIQLMNQEHFVQQKVVLTK